MPLREFISVHSGDSSRQPGTKVKLIFVVPPDRFEGFRKQNYIFPTHKNTEKGKGKEVDEYDSAPWDDDEVPDDDGPWSKMKLFQEVEGWVAQYVMVNVGPLLQTVDKRIESQVKKIVFPTMEPFRLETRSERGRIGQGSQVQERLLEAFFECRPSVQFDCTR